MGYFSADRCCFLPNLDGGGATESKGNSIDLRAISFFSWGRRFVKVGFLLFFGGDMRIHTPKVVESESWLIEVAMGKK